MRVALTTEQRELRTAIRGILAAACNDEGGRVDRGEGVAQRALRALAGSGMLGLPFPVDLGGEGAGLFETGLLFHEAGRALCPSLVTVTLATGLSLHRIIDHGGAVDPVAASGWIEPLIKADATATCALWQPHDARRVEPSLRAHVVDGAFVLDGRLRFVENVPEVDLLVVSARRQDNGEWIVAAVRTDARGLVVTPVSMFGRDPVGHLDLDSVPAEQVATVTADVLDRCAQEAVALQCMEMVGGAERVLEDTVAHVAQREQFGRPIGSFQAVQHIVADLRIGLDAARLAAWRAVWRVGREPAARSVAIAKIQANEAYRNATLQAHQLMGGMGFLRETDLHLWSERAKLGEIRNGSADVALGWLADDLVTR